MRKWILGFVLALVAGAAAADTPAQVVQSFMVDVTAAAQGFTIASKVGTTVRQAGCKAWLIENDDAAATVYVKFSIPAGPNQPPVAVATDATLNQLRLKPGQSKRLDFFVNTYISIIGTGDAAVRFEQACLPPGS